uniref:Rab9 effector protein with kelch motifs n=1 Tax=Mesocestoides corti TaxID=53468 RepID=A0A5K3EH07_MESCO
MIGAPVKLGVWHKCDVSNFAKDIASSRVGHTAHQLCTGEKSDWVLLVGGANCSSCCKSSLLYNIRKGQVFPVRMPESTLVPGFERYEQATVLTDKEKSLGCVHFPLWILVYKYPGASPFVL